MNAPQRIAAIPGDGIGREAVPAGLRVLEAAARRHALSLQFDHFDFASCDYYLRHGRMLPADWQAQLAGYDAIFFSAVGWPASVPDHVSVWGSILTFRREFDQYVNLRPVLSLPGIESPLKGRGPGDIDILTAHFVLHPDWFDVVVASNLFGDILSDFGPACTGTIGIAPSANLNPERRFPSLFEPVHGSAPDIAGQGIANPVGQIWSGALMLDFLGHPAAHDSILAAIKSVLGAGPAQAPLTPDLGGTGTTRALGAAIAAAL